MKWYYITQVSHVHVRVFINGGMAGTLCFRVKEFEEILAQHKDNPYITFINEALKSI